jgi:hypothetical protein
MSWANRARAKIERQEMIQKTLSEAQAGGWQVAYSDKKDSHYTHKSDTIQSVLPGYVETPSEPPEQQPEPERTFYPGMVPEWPEPAGPADPDEEPVEPDEFDCKGACSWEGTYAYNDVGSQLDGI